MIGFCGRTKSPPESKAPSVTDGPGEEGFIMKIDTFPVHIGDRGWNLTLINTWATSGVSQRPFQVRLCEIAVGLEYFLSLCYVLKNEEMSSPPSSNHIY